MAWHVHGGWITCHVIEIEIEMLVMSYVMSCHVIYHYHIVVLAQKIEQIAQLLRNS